MWTTDKLREVMLLFKPTLLNLFNIKNGMQAKKLIQNAPDRFLVCLLYILYNISIGRIKLHRPSYPSLFKSKRASVLAKKLNTKQKLRKLIDTERSSQVKFLSQFASQYPILLKMLFHNVSNPEHNNPSINNIEDGQEKQE